MYNNQELLQLVIIYSILMSSMFDTGVICKEKLAISELPLASFSKRGLVLNHLYENEFKLHMYLTYYLMKG